MDPVSKKFMAELEEMARVGRMLRNMSYSRMMPNRTGSWQPPLDLYEAEDEFYLYVDLAGVSREELSVIADERKVRISGVRRLPAQRSIACVHQLEIELGSFDRMLPLPSSIDVDRVSSEYSEGILVITLPKRKRTGKVQIRISSGAE